MTLIFGIFGCAQSTVDIPVVETENMETEHTEIVDEEEPGAEDTESESGAESESHNNEIVNASGMTLRDDTVLLVTVTEYVSPTYNRVYEEYEYDSENRITKLTEYLHGEVKHEYEYEYKVIGVE